MMNNSAILEAESNFAPQILGAFKNLMINGKPVAVKLVKDRMSDDKGERPLKIRPPANNTLKPRYRK